MGSRITTQFEGHPVSMKAANGLGANHQRGGAEHLSYSDARIGGVGGKRTKRFKGGRR